MAYKKIKMGSLVAALIATSASAFAVSSTVSGIGVLGTPTEGSTISGIGVISGYHCTSEDIDIYIDGISLGKAGAGTTLLGTQGVCGRTNTGYSLLYNFNNLQPGQHVVEAYANGIFLESHYFNSVRSGGVPWLSGASKTTTVQDFPSPGQTATLEWVQSQQNFLVTIIHAPNTAPDTGNIAACTSASTFTVAQYNLITDTSSKAQIDAILGCAGSIYTSTTSDGSTMDTYLWGRYSIQFVLVGFTDGVFFAKSKYGF